MMSEQPPKFICELCGGAHPTSEHESIAKKREEIEAGISHLESEPSPEIVEKIMEKVLDLDTPGLGYTTIMGSRDISLNVKLANVFKLGLLSGMKDLNDEEKQTPERLAGVWVKLVREKHPDNQIGLELTAKDGKKVTRWPVSIFFNIVGRHWENYNPQKTQISQSTWAMGPDVTAILFDLSSWQEIDHPQANTRHQKHMV